MINNLSKVSLIVLASSMMLTVNAHCAKNFCDQISASHVACQNAQTDHQMKLYCTDVFTGYTTYCKNHKIDSDDACLVARKAVSTELKDEIKNEQTLQILYGMNATYFHHACDKLF